MASNEPPSLDPQRAGRVRGLGRGLSALIPGVSAVTESAAQEIPVDQIRPNPRQPRAGFSEEAFGELVASVREQGVLQPVLVRPVAAGYELVAGERRWRAAVAAGLRTIPAVVREMDDRASAEAALVENLQREDLNPVERAVAYRRLIDEFRLTQEDVARRVGKSQPAVANSLRLLSLPSQVLASLQAGRISEGHARALLSAPNEAVLLSVWRRVEASGLSVRETERIIKRSGIPREIRRMSGKSRDLINIEQVLSSELGAPTTITIDRNGAGNIRILFYSTADLERLVEKLRGGGSR